ncbi:uncharacterized protein LOC128579445 [Nycticebus coucang]|uniref:uncharacterized protein LOC128579445 n=1 Tax=Nycticebus coucang TaxID=9470 RepID=UPI00234DCC8A|nr:uncharacterized protein LOC128579445 [Nycticebus coucang]
MRAELGPRRCRGRRRRRHFGPAAAARRPRLAGGRGGGAAAGAAVHAQRRQWERPGSHGAGSGAEPATHRGCGCGGWPRADLCGAWRSCVCGRRRRGPAGERSGDKVKYQKYLTVLQTAIGVTPSNRSSLLPLKRKLWVTPSSENPNGATSSVSQGKPSLRRIKGRLPRSKSLDSFNFCELTVDALQKGSDVSRERRLCFTWFQDCSGGFCVHRAWFHRVGEDGSIWLFG